MSGERLDQFRVAIMRHYEAQGMSMNAFAESIGYPQSAVWWWLTGAKMMSPWFALRIKHLIPELAPLADAAMTDIANLRQAKRDQAAAKARQQRETG